MKPSSLLSISAALLFVGCSGSGLSNKIHTLNVSASSTKPTTLLAPAKETEFAAAAERETAFVEQVVRTSTLDSIGQFQRFQRGSDSGADATVVFDAIRHGVTRVSEGLYAPTVEADIRVVGPDNKQLLRRTGSANVASVIAFSVCERFQLLTRLHWKTHVSPPSILAWISIPA